MEEEIEQKQSSNLPGRVMPRDDEVNYLCMYGIYKTKNIARINLWIAILNQVMSVEHKERDVCLEYKLSGLGHMDIKMAGQ